VRIDLRQTRVDLKAGLNQPTDWLERLTLRVGHNDYQHVEHAIDDADGTLFKNRGVEARLEAVHAPLGAWRGVLGLQLGSRDFSAIGEETIVPDTQVRDAGLFWVEQADYSPLKLQLGARYDHRSLDPDGSARVALGALSLSSGAIWEFAEHWHLALNLDRAQRAPEEEELFVHGAHDATGSFELGDPTLGKETSNQIDLGLHYHSDVLQASLDAYANRFRDFIYLAATGLTEEDLPVRQWSQHDATFHGLEAEAKLKLLENANGRFDLRLFGDSVRAQLTDGAGNLPRIAPARFGTELQWQRDSWRAALGAVRYAAQDHTAEFETPTDGYTWVTAHLSYGFDTGRAQWELFLDGNNLTNQVARAATSFLKDRAPLPGRTVAFGVRAYF
jgi:iron complex outermembrane receptor protein